MTTCLMKSLRLNDVLQLISEVNTLDAESRSILLLFNKGLTDAEIGESLGLKRSTVQYKKARLFEELRKRLSDF